MIEVNKDIFVGTDNDCVFNPPEGLAIIHACKYPCHSKAVRYKGSLPKTHPNYLILERGNHLFLNMVDMDQELSPIYTNPIMKAAIQFIDEKILTNKIFIHCNQGQSRSPSIALVYLANKGIINNTSFNGAFQDFIKLYKIYLPGKGIGMYLNRNWQTLMKL